MNGKNIPLTSGYKSMQTLIKKNNEEIIEIKSMLKDLLEKVDRLDLKKSEDSEDSNVDDFKKNFGITNADSKIGDIREQIHRFGYGCFLEVARNTSFWHKISDMQDLLVKNQNDAEVYYVYAALAKLNKEEIAEWKKVLEEI